MTVDTLALAHHIERIRRIVVPCRSNLVTREFAGGWLSARPGGTPGEFASVTPDRVYWLTRERPASPDEIQAAEDAALSVDVRRVFIWLAPWAWSPELDESLAARGASRVPDVEYLVLTREPAITPSAPGCPFDVRRVDRENAPDVLERAATWYGADGAAAVRRGTARPDLELFAAFEGSAPVATAMLIDDGEWAYLGWAGTHPAKRGRGAQTALIAARLRSAAERGTRWCTCETVTADATSLRNLRRAGFRESLAWRVYRWDLPGRAPA